jgi:hypothetical protein
MPQIDTYLQWNVNVGEKWIKKFLEAVQTLECTFKFCCLNWNAGTYVVYATHTKNFKNNRKRIYSSKQLFKQKSLLFAIERNISQENLSKISMCNLNYISTSFYDVDIRCKLIASWRAGGIFVIFYAIINFENE